MADVREYIRWRGDLSYRQDCLNPVDALVFCALSYVRFEEILPESTKPRLLRDVAKEFLEIPDADKYCRSKNDPDLLVLAAQSDRFGSCSMVLCRSEFLPEQETQFFGVTFLLDDGSSMIVFRGTDSSVIGWKEDFNMSFQQTVPCQLLALSYVRDVAFEYPGPIRICGHSKGGNMAVFAGARSSPGLQQRILDIFNNDGPGFSDYMMGDPGYKAIVPVIHTFVPQSSVIGMLMDHEEPYTIIKARQIGLMQHDIYNWEISGPGFIRMEEITADSRFLNVTIRNWAASMSSQQRNDVVDAIFGMLQEGRVEDTEQLFQPRNIRGYLKYLGANEETRKTITVEFQGFLDAAKKTMLQLAAQKELEAPKQKPLRRK